ncbi:MAG TPA: hypothetical protein VGD43_01740 [Micromonospora sp.]
MANVQQPEMRRNEHNPTVQDSQEPGPGRSPGGGATGHGRRPVPSGQASPYGPRPRRTARDDSDGGAGHRR